MKSTVSEKIYWSTTLLFCFLMILDGVSALARLPSEMVVVAHLGFPVFCLTVMGIAKLLGVCALIQTRSVVLKEWAYAGFTIIFVLASISHWYAGDSAAVIGVPVLFLGGMFMTYFLWKDWLSLKRVR